MIIIAYGSKKCGRKQYLFSFLDLTPTIKAKQLTKACLLDQLILIYYHSLKFSGR
jgi:hypothetical protein